jgi:hypothetical protein
VSVDEQEQLVVDLVRALNLKHTPRVIRRGSNHSGWADAMQMDLARITEDYVFHLMDDTLIGAELDAHTVLSLVSAAKHLDANIISLYHFSHLFWTYHAPPLEDVTVSLPSTIRRALPGLLRRADVASQFVVHQNFALWRTAFFAESLSLQRGVSSTATPQQWETRWFRNPTHLSVLELNRSFVLEYQQPHALSTVLDVGHQGRVRRICGCSWLRALVASHAVAARALLLAAGTATSLGEAVQALASDETATTAAHVLLTLLKLHDAAPLHANCTADALSDDEPEGVARLVDPALACRRRPAPSGGVCPRCNACECCESCPTNPRDVTKPRQVGTCVVRVRAASSVVATGTAPTWAVCSVPMGSWPVERH